MRIRHTGQSRNGFTLVELLVAITVIGILMGMLSMAIIPALRRAKEVTITTEMKQLELAFEQFHQKYGFYPPSFEKGTPWSGTVGITDWDKLIPYVNRISPNHAELNEAWAGAGITRLEHWWDEVGQYLDQESSIMFWLSGVCLNKQYPITGGVIMSSGTLPLVAHSFIDDGIERDMFFDFKSGQIVGDQSDEVVYYPLGGSQVPIPASAEGAIYEYKHPHSGTDAEDYNAPDGTVGLTDYRYKYRDAPTYDLGDGNTAYYLGPVNGAPQAIPGSQTDPQYQFANPKGFQMISFGMDGLGGAPGNCFSVNAGTVTFPPPANIDFFGPWGSDNICNFTDGRLDRFTINQ